MPSKLVPSNPAAVMAISRVTPNLTTLSVPFLRFGRIKFGGRATIVRLQTGALAVFSPVALTDEVQNLITDMGDELRYICCPDMEHHIFLGPWKAKYTTAKVIAPAGLREKRAKQGNEDVVIDWEFSKENKHTLVDTMPEELKKEFEFEFWESHANKEIAALHKPDSGTLIEADLLFNLPAKEQYSKTGENPSSGVATKLMHYFTNIHGKGQQRFNWYLACKDKQSFASSARGVYAWDFQRIIPCHGDVIDKDGKEVFRKMFAWHL